MQTLNKFCLSSSRKENMINNESKYLLRFNRKLKTTDVFSPKYQYHNENHAKLICSKNVTLFSFGSDVTWRKSAILATQI